MLTCPYHQPDKCKYHLPCNLTLAMPADDVSEAVKKFVKREWDLCSLRIKVQPSIFVERGEEKQNV